MPLISFTQPILSDWVLITEITWKKFPEFFLTKYIEMHLGNLKNVCQFHETESINFNSLSLKKMIFKSSTQPSLSKCVQIDQRCFSRVYVVKFVKTNLYFSKTRFQYFTRPCRSNWILNIKNTYYKSFTHTRLLNWTLSLMSSFKKV